MDVKFKKKSLDKIARELGVEPVIIRKPSPSRWTPPLERYRIDYGVNHLEGTINGDCIECIMVGHVRYDTLKMMKWRLIRQMLTFDHWEVDIDCETNGKDFYTVLWSARASVCKSVRLDAVATRIIIDSASARLKDKGWSRDISDSPLPPTLLIDYLAETSEEFRAVFKEVL